MKVAVFGSMRSNADPRPSPADLKAFRDACRQIGFELARQGHEAFIATLNEETSDFHVYQGAKDAMDAPGAQAQKTDLVKIYRPNDPYTDKEIDRIVNFPNPGGELDLGKRTVNGSFARSHAMAIQDADAILVISGSSGADYAALIAELIGKPVLPVPLFGGTAAKLWMDKADYYPGLLKDDPTRERVSEQWVPDKSPKAVLDALGALIEDDKRSKARSARAGIPAAIGWLTAGTALPLLWFYTMSQVEIRFSLWLGAALMLSAFMGTFLRAATWKPPEGSDRTIPAAPVLAAMFVGGTHVAFFFMALYFWFLRAAQGTIPVFDDPAEATIAMLALTLIGFIAAFNFEASLKKLRGIGLDLVIKPLKALAVTKA